MARGDEQVHRYEFVAEALRRQIKSGTYPIGSELPTVAALATEFQVSHMTVKGALAVLSAEGVIVTQRGARTRVTAMPAGEAKPLRDELNELRNRVDVLDDRIAALESHVKNPNAPKGN
jgi:DNA-binding GntR family transcriptional regulator